MVPAKFQAVSGLTTSPARNKDHRSIERENRSLAVELTAIRDFLGGQGGVITSCANFIFFSGTFHRAGLVILSNSQSAGIHVVLAGARS